MKFLDIIKQANQNLLRSKARTFLTILAIFIGSFAIILNTAINAAVTSFINEQTDSFGGDGYIEITPAALTEQISQMTGSSAPTEYDPSKNSSQESWITEEKLSQIKKIKHIKSDSVKPYNSSEAEYVTSDKTDKKYKFRVAGLPTNSISVPMLIGRNVDTNSDKYEIAIVDGFAKALGYDSNEEILGKTISIAIKDQALGTTALPSSANTCKLSEYKKGSCIYTLVDASVVGVQAPGIISMGRNWISKSLDSKIFSLASANLPAEYANRTYFATAEYDTNISDSELTTLKNDFKELQLSAMTVDDQVGMIKVFFDVILVVFNIFGVIALIAASIGIINTLLMSVQERTREIGLMKAMGLSSAKVFLSFATEAIMLGFWGSVIGIGISMIVGNIGNHIAHAEGSFLSDLPTFNLVEFTPYNCISITLVIMLIAFLAGTIPAIRAARKNPIEALRYE